MIDNRRELLEKQKQETILLDNPFRWVLFPIKYNRLWNFYKKYEVVFWTAEVISYIKDLGIISEVDRRFVDSIELLFSSRVFISNTGLDSVLVACEFLSQIQVPEARGYFSFTICMENIYKEVFMNYIDVIRKYKSENIKEYDHKEAKMRYHLKLKDIITDNQHYQRKIEFANQLLDSSVPFSEKLIIYTIIKRVFSSGIHLIRQSFFNKEGPVLEQLCDALDRIRRDELFQAEFCLSIARSMKTKPSNEYIISMLENAITIEKGFIFSIFNLEILEIPREDIVAYLLFSADEILVELKYPRHFNVSNPFSELISDLPAPSQEEAAARQTLTQTLKVIHCKTYQEITDALQFSTSQDF
ncbi:ribonucleoside-diphosphate reductase beta subunit family protein [Cryptosporidium muris RN66]|uniref:Ribonucleoside-diphosphate reductase beta subunit family protein n=1 Tax=Cryptosporidium muris (strain RN66) TaxID=441375 RepID=B6ABJ1_CRYMR|nr:ribonucleoside-diphosphate reductase beta subunit family protein [Cryptosporidium muris RN66]EEA05743.1 ribonucleoside-diphosphate reductase beta subunit family protein [Cryptosporidium muris RN66]|eukprot:XP_002140092.1 ribonucleoside-diphosphate reductase beta subunit family protein [Cryptosporidium muris RN66]